jgi:hypothetical protein
MSYTAYDVAHQLLQIRTNYEIDASNFCELPKDVLSALLWSLAEWRNVHEMETLIEYGADPHEKHDDFTVLEVFLQGHDGYWRDGTPSNISQVDAGVKMLAKHGVTRADLKHEWILDDCKEIINKSEYLRNFFGLAKPECVKFYWHAPRAEKFEKDEGIFTDMAAVMVRLTLLTPLDQYVAVLEYKGKVTRYLVTKGAGPLAIIAMEHEPGWSKQQEMTSNIVNFVMARDDYPTLPCEDDE